MACAALASGVHAAPTPTQATRADRLAEIGHYRDQAHWVDALAAIERAQQVEPNDDLLYKLQVLTLGDIGNAHRAWRLYQARPQLFDADQKA
ncbi:MAG TPA: poly-beta-1,6 N-acetyl-D-glucosamine export porin PgaA, partial [Stenotrophomonas sp.]|nr:poly-beta-1,6 N-acetyl-D-glucosamine export porin PgaA [Stenotrophomonas sp.]